ncbi:MAG: hypothetical protein K2K87_01305 [Lachnospiraceae bacterium]|nr:hypothetical protein [Lachnospiraceae bacterium]
MNETEEKRPVPAWAALLPENEFISYLPSYTGGAYFDLFDEYTYPYKETGDITYYVYNPVKQGADPNGSYPVLVWLHGATNSLNGKFCICNCGGELFASPDYQKAMGGAYIVVPLANEKTDENGRLTETFSEQYLQPLKSIIERVCLNAGTGKIFAMGGSLGGFMTWKLAERFPELFDGIIPISTNYVPADEQLETIARHNVAVFVTLGQHDETLDFDRDIAPHIQKMEDLGFLCYFPEWVKNGDGGVASLFYGWEMGQHCMINQIQANLFYDNGAPYDPRLPHGVTGWIRQVCEHGRLAHCSRE